MGGRWDAGSYLMKKGAFSKPWGHGGWRSIVVKQDFLLGSSRLVSKETWCGEVSTWRNWMFSLFLSHHFLGAKNVKLRWWMANHWPWNFPGRADPFANMDGHFWLRVIDKTPQKTTIYTYSYIQWYRYIIYLHIFNKSQNFLHFFSKSHDSEPVSHVVCG